MEYNTVPLKISSLVAKYQLTYPFVIMKAEPSVAGVYNGLSLTYGSHVVVTGYDGGAFYLGYYKTTKYRIMDSSVWLLVEPNDGNVIMMEEFKSRPKCKRTTWRKL